MDPNSRLLIVKASVKASSILAESEKKVTSGLRPKKPIGFVPDKKKNSTSTSINSIVPLEPEIRSKTDSESISNTLLERFCENILSWRLGTEEDAEMDFKLHLNNFLPDSFSSAADYIDRWEPLFLEETRASVISNLPSTRQLPCSAVRLINTDPMGQRVLTRLDCISIPPTVAVEASTSTTASNTSSSSSSNSSNNNQSNRKNDTRTPR